LIARALVREGYEADWLPVFTAMIEDVLGCALDGARLRLAHSHRSNAWWKWASSSRWPSSIARA
jgi:hypothetical protein